MHIGIAGNIGCGKTTLTEMLAKHYKWEPRYESVVENPYMDDYYKDIQRWSFAMEVFFLKERFKDVLQIAGSDKTIIQDRTLHEGVFVFTANNYAQGNMSDRDFETYMELYEMMVEKVKLPDLLIYLRASVPHLVENIQKRGRECEQKIPIEYLRGLNDRYEDFIRNKYKGKVLIVDVDNLDYKNKPEDFYKTITPSMDILISSNLERLLYHMSGSADAVFGGRGSDIRNTRERMFRQLGSEMMTLVRLQFIVSVIVYLLIVIFLPERGYAGLVMRIYPMVAAGYFVLFLMYAEIIFLYYFEDLKGALVTAVSFCVCTLAASLLATHFIAIFYGFGVWAGSLVGLCGQS